MLSLYFGELDESKRTVYFDYYYRVSWLEDEFARRVIREVDDSELIGERVIKSPVLGVIPPERLSGGVKALFTLKNEDIIMSLDSLGENCYTFLKEIADSKDILLDTTNYVSLFRLGGFEKIRIHNDDSIVYNCDELFDKYLMYGD